MDDAATYMIRQNVELLQKNACRIVVSRGEDDVQNRSINSWFTAK